jgi:hypothetical protein
MTKELIELGILKGRDTLRPQNQIFEIHHKDGLFYCGDKVFSRIELTKFINENRQPNCLQIFEIRNYDKKTY